MNTRFNPTPCGNLHLGHVVVCLVNEYQAHQLNHGKFIVRFDDNQEWWRMKLSQNEMDTYRENMTRDIEWLEIPVDAWTCQYEMRDEKDYWIRQFSAEYGMLPMRDLRSNFLRGPHLAYTSSHSYPYAPNMTAEAVILDYLDQISHLIRGEDLTFQGSLYWLFCDLWRLPMPEQIYLPRLTSLTEGELTEVSKSKGGFEIAYFREKGYSPDDLKEMLVEVCLKDPGKDWDWHNIKRNIVWDHEANSVNS